MSKQKIIKIVDIKILDIKPINNYQGLLLAYSLIDSDNNTIITKEIIIDKNKKEYVNFNNLIKYIKKQEEI